MNQEVSSLLPGTEVLARGLRWQVVLTQQLGQQALLRLRSMDGSLRGTEVDFLYPFESVQPVVNELQPERAGRLRNWLIYHQAFLLEQELGGDALLAVQPGRLRLEPYQLVPVLRAIRMSRPRLLLADGVGLGKTIQAGLVLTELVARRIAHRILIVSPAGPLMEQWKTEMAERFGLRLEVINRASLEETRRRIELGANPFDHIPLGLASIDFLKQERVLEQLERSGYDVVVIDEAHHCMDLGSIGDREDSQRRRLAQVLSRRCDAFLLLTATPHDGNDRSFASLCELLDPSLVTGQGQLRGDRYKTHVIRRLKQHVVDTNTGRSLFRDRLVTPVPVVANEVNHPDFMALQRSLLDLIAPELRRAFQSRRFNDVLSFIALLKRSVSTAAACQSTLSVVAERFQGLVNERAEDQDNRRERLRTLRDYHRRLERFGTLSVDEEGDQQYLETEDLAQRLAEMQREIRRGSYQLKRTTDVMSALDDLIALAEYAQEQDPKIEQIVRLIDSIRLQEPHANVLVYTEYVTSQQAVVNALRSRFKSGILTMNGDDDEATRKQVTERFRNQDNQILVSTDTAAEGLNLQDRCHHLIHVELPFNPNRLEQRNGRIDRYGQMREPKIYYLYLHQTFEERILLRLIAKYERQRALLTFVPNTLGLTSAGDGVDERLLAGLMDEDEKLFHSEGALFDFSTADTESTSDPATQELLAEIDRSLKGYQQATQTQSWLGAQGLNAGAALLAEVDQARRRGIRSSAVDLADFVQNAILMDGGQIEGKLTDRAFTAFLPPAWTHGLTDLPGFDAASRRIGLTTRLEVTRDEQGNLVSFLGRAHPLVRRALDRVRSVAFGGDTQSYQDARVSAVKAAVSEPTLLCTFLGRQMSQAGRELEQVLAVQIGATAEPIFFPEAGAWQELADPTKAINVSNIWNQHFVTWGREAMQQARQLCERRFVELLDVIQEEWRIHRQEEAEALDGWLEQRVAEITGTQVVEAIQIALFSAVSDSGAIGEDAAADWMLRSAPLDRLTGFATDGGQPIAKRSEADGVLRTYRQRRQDIEKRMALATPEVLPLGMLMIVPE